MFIFNVNLSANKEEKIEPIKKSDHLKKHYLELMIIWFRLNHSFEVLEIYRSKNLLSFFSKINYKKQPINVEFNLTILGLL